MADCNNKSKAKLYMFFSIRRSKTALCLQEVGVYRKLGLG